MPTSTMAFMGRFPLLMGRFPTLMGRFTDFILSGRFLPLENPLENAPLRKGALRGFSFLGLVKAHRSESFFPRDVDDFAFSFFWKPGT